MWSGVLLFVCVDRVHVGVPSCTTPLKMTSSKYWIRIVDRSGGDVLVFDKLLSRFDGDEPTEKCIRYTQLHSLSHIHSHTFRYASLLRACTGRPLSEVDQGTLDRHGMRSAAIGRAPQPWLQKFAADNLRFVEFERKALPCALMRSSNGQRSLYRWLHEGRGREEDCMLCMFVRDTQFSTDFQWTYIWLSSCWASCYTSLSCFLLYRIAVRNHSDVCMKSDLHQYH